MILNDYFRMRVEMNLAQFPDDMVRDTARDVELRCLEAGIRCGDLAWLIEAASRAEPRVHELSVSESIKPKEGVG